MQRRTGYLSRYTKATGAACAALIIAAAPVQADPTIGFGLSISYGQQKVDTGVGVRVFSDNERDSNVASVGLDYMLISQSWRATIGAAHLDDDTYVGLDLGFDGDFDFGVSAGWLKEQTEQVFAQATGLQPIIPDQSLGPKR
jgi:hypothetical protein